MKSFIGIILLLTIFATSAFAAQASGFFRDPKNPGKCTIKENLVLSTGDVVKDPNADCARIVCGYQGFAEFYTCKHTVVKGCKLGNYVDKSLPFPECCERHAICM